MKKKLDCTNATGQGETFLDWCEGGIAERAVISGLLVRILRQAIAESN